MAQPLRNPLMFRWFSQPSTLLRQFPKSSSTNTMPTMRQFSTRFTFPRPTTRTTFFRSNNNAFRTSNKSNSNPFRRFTSSKSSESLSTRLRKLSREYGWSALGVYLLLSALDFPFCFAAVRLLGVERIGHYEHMLVESAKEAVESVWSRKEAQKKGEDGNVDANAVKEAKENEEENKVGEKKNGEGASLWTQVVLAYAIHKSLIFIRVPITAAITPKVVKILRQWGWDLARGKPKGL